MIDRRDGPARGIGISADDRGVSEVVAFVLTFAIILGSVGLLYSTAFGAMMDYQENEQETNAVRAMDSMTDNFNDLLRSNGVNERFGELSLRDGTLSTGSDGTAVNITINESGTERTLGTNDEQQFAGYGEGVTAELGEFAYESDDSTIAYEGGGLVRGDETGSFVHRRPQIRCNTDSDTVVISLLTISSEDRSVRSSSSLGVRLLVEDRSSAVYTDVDEATISVEDTEYEDAWNGVLSGAWEDSEDLQGTCSDVDRVVVTVVEADVIY